MSTSTRPDTADPLQRAVGAGRSGNRGGDQAQAGSSHILAGTGKVRMVEQIIGAGAKGKPSPFVELERLVNGGVSIEMTPATSPVVIAKSRGQHVTNHWLDLVTIMQSTSCRERPQRLIPYLV